MKTLKPLLVILALSLASCISHLQLHSGGTEAHDEGAVVEFDELTAYMSENSMDMPDILTDWITTSKAIFDAGTDNFFIIDLRGSDKKPANGTVDFEDGHIPGAHLAGLADVITYEEANNTGNLPVVVACYSGQTAGYAVTALRLSGVPAKVLLYGMSSWHADFDVWTGSTGNVALGSDGWDMTDDVPALPSYGTPVIDTGLDAGDDILAARVMAMLAGGFNYKTSAVVLADHADYNVLNYWDAADWELYGHVAGAYQITPGNLAIMDDQVKSADPDKPNVIYCWTGQTAAMISAYLNVLGYEAYPLVYSANGMVYDNLQAHKWSSDEIGGYAYETGR